MRDGRDGRDGEDGLSAYQIALRSGFKGTEGEWQKSLRGKDGLPGKGGAKGETGKRGPRGERGEPGTIGKAGERGPKGEQGPKGDRGPEGPTGPRPAHEWKGTELRFEQSDGEWGRFVDLKGPPGLAGAIVSAGSGEGNFQPLDSDLTAIAALTTQPFGRSLLTAADAEAGRALLEVGAGGVTEWGDITGTLADQADLQTALDAKQPIDSDLTAIAALTTTAFGRSFLDRANAAAGRTLLELGTAATSNTGDFDAAGSAAAAQAASQPLDSDLTAIAALTTTAYGRGLLALANAAALAAEIDSFFLTPTEGDAAYQPLDSDLTAIAALTTTSYGRGLLALASQAALIAEVSSAYQPLDATLTALAGANWAANSVPVGSGADTLSQVALAANQFLARASSGNAVAKSITDFGLSLVDDADAATARATIGFGAFAYTQDGTAKSSGASTNFPFDATTPQNNEGTEYTELNTSITPKHATSTLIIDVELSLCGSAATTATAGLFVDSVADCLKAWVTRLDAADHMYTMRLRYIVASGSTNARTYKVRWGGTATVYINRSNSSSDQYGAAALSNMTITEVPP